MTAKPMGGGSNPMTFPPPREYATDKCHTNIIEVYENYSSYVCEMAYYFTFINKLHVCSEIIKSYYCK